MLVVELNGGVETHPLIPQLCVATATFEEELLAMKAARTPTTSSRAIARFRVLGFK
jgi:hypothetical protein